MLHAPKLNPLTNQPKMLQQLAAQLPQTMEGQTIDQQSRAVLTLLIQATGTAPELAQVPADPKTCPNCGAPTASERSPYCSTTCREEAGFIRQFRSGLEEATINDEERQIALGQVLWHVLGGGYPRRQSLVPEKSRQRVLEKAENVCQECGQTATTVDHKGSGCNRTINLRAVCQSCCREKQYTDQAFTGRPEFQEQLNRIAARVASPVPVRCCDDAKTWDWRAFVNQRKALLADQK